MPWGYAAAAVGSALISGSAAEDAEDAQYAASERARADQAAQNALNRQDNIEALDARNASLSRMRELLGVSENTGAAGFGSLGGRIDAGDVTNDPGYQFGLREGQNAIGNRLAARGMRNSGASGKELARYATDYGASKYNEAFNRQVANRSAVLNPLQSLAGLSQTGASTIANAGQNFANQSSALQAGIGNAQGASLIAQNNALSNGVNQLGGWYASQNRNQSQPWAYSANDGLSNSNSMNAFNYNQYGSGSGGFTIDGY